MRPITSIVFASLLLCASPCAFAQAQQAEAASPSEVAERLPHEADHASSGEVGHSEAIEAAEAAAVAAPALVAVQAVEERPICRQEKPSGSNRPVRVCRTKSQMQADRDASRERMERGTFRR